MAVYHQQKRNADLLRHRLTYPITHELNLPHAVDLRPWMTDIEDQSEMGSCVANSIADSLEYLYRRYTGRNVNVSRLFIDFNARLSHLNWTKQQPFVVNPGGSFETDTQAAIRALQQYGFCADSFWPYDEQFYMYLPPKEVYDEAKRRSIVPLRVPITIDSVRTFLANRIPVLVGIKINSDEAYYNQGYIQIPDILPDEGYHSCLVVGYNDRTQHFIVRNSLGQEWGDNGYCYVPYQYLVDKRLVATGDSFWAIAQIIPRRLMRQEDFSYPNFTQHQQQFMQPPMNGDYERQRRHKHRYRRRRPY